jgi:hypothetical protein
MKSHDDPATTILTEEDILQIAKQPPAFRQPHTESLTVSGGITDNPLPSLPLSGLGLDYLQGFYHHIVHWIRTNGGKMTYYRVQVARYMDDHRCRFGFYSTYEKTWCISQSSSLTFHNVRPVWHHQKAISTIPPIRQCFLYLAAVIEDPACIPSSTTSVTQLPRVAR